MKGLTMLSRKQIGLVVLAMLSFMPVHAKQVINLQAQQWQLISFYELPVALADSDSNIESVLEASFNAGIVEQVWSYEDQQWKHWLGPSDAIDLPASAKGSKLSELSYGRGYWIKGGSQSGNIVIDIPQADRKPISSINYDAGWNLVGFAIDKPVKYSFAFASADYTQIWRYVDYEGNAGFQVIEKGRASNAIINEQFTQLEPGKGYWVYFSTAGQELAPKLKTLLPPDLDVSPFSTAGETIPYGQAYSWADIDVSNDTDFDGCGDYDYANTQDWIDFGDFVNTLPLTISNGGNGVLSWQAKIVNCETEIEEVSSCRSLSDYSQSTDFLTFREEVYDPQQRLQVTQFNNESTGAVTQIDKSINLNVNRAGLVPGSQYMACIQLSSNGLTSVINPETDEVESLENSKLIKVSMQVPDIIGDYEVQVRLDELITEDGSSKADQHNPLYFLSFIRDGNGIKGFLDNERSLLITDLTYLSGYDIRNPASNFQVFGSMLLPADAARTFAMENPFNEEIRREFTFIGERSNGRDGLSGKDLKGQYFENITGIISGKTLRLTGTFEARQLSNEAKRIDQSVSANNTEQLIPKKEIETYDLTIAERTSISSMKLLLDIEHAKPEELKITLTAPTQRQIGSSIDITPSVVIHQGVDSDTNPNDGVYDFEPLPATHLADVDFEDERKSFESLSRFTGYVTSGKWTLTIENKGRSLGKLKSWALLFEGARRYQIKVQVGTEYADDLILNLTGCGVNYQAKAEADGYAYFDGLIPCDYTISTNHIAFEEFSAKVRVTDCRASSLDCGIADSYYQNVDFTGKIAREYGDGKSRIVVTPLVVKDSENLDLRFKAVLQNVSANDSAEEGDILIWQLVKVVAGQPLRVISHSNLSASEYIHTLEYPALIDSTEENGRAGIYAIIVRDANNRIVATSANITIQNPYMKWLDAGGNPIVDGGGVTIQLSTQASAGYYMDSATFDIDRMDFKSADFDHSGENDSDCFSAELTTDPLYSTNDKLESDALCAASKTYGIKKGHSTAVLIKDIDKANKNEDDAGAFHVRAHVTLGQPFMGGSSYGSVYQLIEDGSGDAQSGEEKRQRINYRLDTGIQTQSGNE